MNSDSKVIVSFLLLLAFVVIGSIISVRMWDEVEEKVELPGELVLQEDMTLLQIARENDLPNSLMKKVFELSGQSDLQKKFSDFSLTVEETEIAIKKQLALAAENATKNWEKILLKFMLWSIFLLLIFFLLKGKAITSEKRKWFYFVAVIIFGIVLSADPGPMGAIKDGIVLFGRTGAFFPPRLIALTVFLLMVILANKFICSWGCQVGTLQDLIFRLNRNKHNPILPQYKLSFKLTNTIRIIFFFVFTSAAFIWALDLIEHIDPFKIFKPATLSIGGILFILIVMFESLFIYRPWCHLFCPFGLIGWLLEKLSVFKIKVDYRKCIACENCVESCPSTVMNAILKRDKIIPDCFSCGTCLEVCPTNAISFEKGKRKKPPAGKFENNASKKSFLHN